MGHICNKPEKVYALVWNIKLVWLYIYSYSFVLVAFSLFVLTLSLCLFLTPVYVKINVIFTASLLHYCFLHVCRVYIRLVYPNYIDFSHFNQYSGITN
jgi:FlaA1/EpsC-like NDP-sugar epimerase